MRLDKIRLVNYRGHADTTILFSPSFNVLIGANGSGKTSALTAISDAFRTLPGYLSKGMPPLALERAVRIERVESGSAVRFEPRYPLAITCTATIQGNSADWTLTQGSGASPEQVQGVVPGSTWKRSSSASGASEPLDTLPVLAFYRASRQWQPSSSSVLAAATAKNSRLDAYDNYWDASADAGALQAWAIAKSLERFQLSSETGLAFDDVQNDELALVNSALFAAIPEIKGIRYDMREKSLLVEWKESVAQGERFSIFDNLSDGQRAIVGLVADIARRMCLLNPHLGVDVINGTPGIVLIDELDIHLHPKWQRTLTTGLQAAFPAVQFIVASHSPQVLSEMRPEQIIVLGDAEVAHPQVSYGLDSSAVLEEIMDAPKRPELVKESLSTIFDALDRNDLEAARLRMDELRTTAPGLPELTRAEAILRRKGIIGR